MTKMTIGPVVLLAAAAWIGSYTQANSQTAADRAGELKTWREQCSDPDIDLRTAYVEAAVASDDVAVARVCIRQSIESNNTDIRNLGLRAALAAADRILFSVEPSETLAKAFADAKGDTSKLAEVERTYEMGNWRYLESGLVFEIQDANLADGTSRWFPLVQAQKPNEKYVGQATVVGDRVNWVGSARLLPRSNCLLNLRLIEGARLTGTFKCGNLEPFPVSADLL
jgi:hypothetical protein